jgi:flagellar basal-body rod modification protein FlgD
MTTAVTNPAAPTATSGGTDSTALGRARLADNFDTFLSLLTTQLKNQDPLSPLDSNQFTQQIVQMTGVEQQLATNDLLKKLVANTGSGVATAVSLIGKEVRATASNAMLKDGQATWTYNLDRDASDVKLEISDSKGNVLRSIAPTDNKSGEHVFKWDGKSASGTTLPSGEYTLKVTAKDSAGNAVTNKIFADGVVTGVEQTNGTTLLTVNGAQVPWDQLVTIRQPDPTATTSNSSTTTSGSNNNSTPNNSNTGGNTSS